MAGIADEYSKSSMTSVSTHTHIHTQQTTAPREGKTTRSSPARAAKWKRNVYKTTWIFVHTYIYIYSYACPRMISGCLCLGSQCECGRDVLHCASVFPDKRCNLTVVDVQVNLCMTLKESGIRSCEHMILARPFASTTHTVVYTYT